MTVNEITDAALTAAVDAARNRGLAVDDARIISARGNLLVHLAPSPVVARVATLTAFSRRDPFAWLRREVSVAAYAARHGGPVAAPTSAPLGVDPGPHRSAGFAVTFWTYLPPGPPDAGRASPEITGRALAALHLSLADYPQELPWLLPATDQIAEGLDALEGEHIVDEPLVAALRARHCEVLAHVTASSVPAIVLHGDAHAGNLLSTCTAGSGQDWAWTDLEETCRGPREWDLAVMARSWDPPEEGSRALAAYSAVAGTPVPRREDLAPFDRIRDLEAAVWAACMAHQYPQRYQELARQLLDRAISGGLARGGGAGQTG